MTKFRLPLAILALSAPAIFLTACGGVPGDSIATVDGKQVTKKALAHAEETTVKTPGSGLTELPDGPNFTKCIAAQRKQLGTPKKGQPTPTDTQLKQQCQRISDGIRTQAQQGLISNLWLEGQAKAMGIKIPDAEVKKNFDQQKNQLFKKDADFQKFLKQTGYTIPDLMTKVRTSLLVTKIRDRVTHGKDQVTDKQITDYYNKNKQRFAQPERRDLLVVLTKTAADATKAKNEIQSGTPFADVVKKLSIDQASKSAGGKLPAVAKGQNEKAFDDAIFKAKTNQLEGPVKTQFGFYVFKVTKITPPSQQTEAQAKPLIKQLLASQGGQNALQAFVKSYEAKWKSKTECAKGYIIDTLCKNAPKPKKGAKSTPTPGQ